MNAIEIISIIVGGLIAGGLVAIPQIRKSSKAESIRFLQEQVLALFLHAEKQNWINEDKMGWVVQQVYNRIPVKVLKLAGKFFDQEDVENLVEHLYQQAKERLVEGSKLQ